MDGVWLYVSMWKTDIGRVPLQAHYSVIGLIQSNEYYSVTALLPVTGAVPNYMHCNIALKDATEHVQS